MEHPAITRTRQTGYPEKEPIIYGIDARGIQVHVGDEIYIYDEEFWLVDALSSDAIEVLEHFGAKRIKACYGM